jgi:dihydrofolate reductase
MKLSLIVAMGQNREIGKDNDLLWHLPADMKFFKDTTKGKAVIMGRKNYESIPPKFRPLPGRNNIVISRNADYQAPECYVVTDIQEAIQTAGDLGEEEAFIIGGAQIYDIALQQLELDTLYITEVEASYPDAHAFFPLFNDQNWNKEIIGKQEVSEINPIAFTIYRYDRKS